MFCTQVIRIFRANLGDKIRTLLLPFAITPLMCLDLDLLQSTQSVSTLRCPSEFTQGKSKAVCIIQQTNIYNMHTRAHLVLLLPFRECGTALKKVLPCFSFHYYWPV